MGEIDAIKVVSEAFEKLNDEERGRVLAWTFAKFGGVSQKTPSALAPVTSSASPSKPVGSKAKGSKKAKSVISMDKSLNLAPKGKTSAVQFAAAKKPSNVKEKCVVAVYYLRETIALPKVTAEAVFTFFKTVQWPAPADMKNTLQQAGSTGWLDTADSQDIKLTSGGENLVEHELPSKVKG